MSKDSVSAIPDCLSHFRKFTEEVSNIFKFITILWQNPRFKCCAVWKTALFYFRIFIIVCKAFTPIKSLFTARDLFALLLWMDFSLCVTRVNKCGVSSAASRVSKQQREIGDTRRCAWELGELWRITRIFNPYSILNCEKGKGMNIVYS